MRAARIHRTGAPEVVTVGDVGRPRARGDQVLVRVAGASLNHIDISMRRGELKGISRWAMPMTLGWDFAGEIVDCGHAASAFLPGECVVGMSGRMGGACAEFIAVSQDNLAIWPAEVDLETAAGLPLAGLTALQMLREKARVQKNDGVPVLVTGASGGVGTFAVQLAKVMGCRVTAMCRKQHFDLMGELGADAVVDYSEFRIEDLNEKFAVILDCAATADFESARKVLTNDGVHVSTRPKGIGVAEGVLARFRGGQRYTFLITKPRGVELAFLLRLIQQGKLRTVIDHVFPLGNVAEAHKHFEKESLRGKVIVRVEEDCETI